MLGYSESELREKLKNYSTFVFYDDRQYLKQRIKKHLFGKGPLTVSFRALKKNGLYIWLEANITAIKDNDDLLFYCLYHDISAHKKLEEELTKKAHTDSLTGLLNRAHFRDLVERHLSEKDAKGIFIMLDTDNFKLINDRHGHNVGDIVLKRLAGRITDCFPADVHVSRVGGDEFAIFIPYYVSPQQLSEKLTELCGRFGENFLFDQNVSVTCSVGACYYPDNGSDYTDLYVNSDTAMLTSKRIGKNRFVIYSDDIVLPKEPLALNAELIFNESNDIIIIIDPQSKEIVYANKKASEITGEQNLVGQKCYSAICGLDSTCADCFIGKRSNIFEKNMTIKGVNYHFSIKGTPLRWGKITAWAEFVHDETLLHNRQKKYLQVIEKQKIIMNYTRAMLNINNVDDSLSLLMQSLAEYYGASYCMLVMANVSAGTIFRRYRWSSQDRHTQIKEDFYSLSSTPMMLEAAQKTGEIIKLSIDQVKNYSPAEYKIFSDLKISNWVTVSFFLGDDCAVANVCDVSKNDDDFSFLSESADLAKQIIQKIKRY